VDLLDSVDRTDNLDPRMRRVMAFRESAQLVRGKTQISAAVGGQRVKAERNRDAPQRTDQPTNQPTRHVRVRGMHFLKSSNLTELELKHFRTEPNSSGRSLGIVREEVGKICFRNKQI
jgi:hypothetical protein